MHPSERGTDSAGDGAVRGTVSRVAGRLKSPVRGDVVAGISVALVLIPQSLAYAELAGVPPVYGLYCAMAAPLFAALMGSSPYLQTGPVAITSLLTLGAVAPLAATGTARFAALAALLALVVGIARVLVGLLRAGVVAHLMSQPVIVWFTVAAAALIVASQVPTLLGAPAAAGNPLAAAGSALMRPGDWDPASIAVGLGTIALVLLGRRIRRSFPWVLAAVIAGLLLNRFGVISVSEVGPIPGGVPAPGLDLPWRDLPALIVPGLAIAFVGFAEAASVARRYAAQERQRWNPDREFVGQGLANLGAGLFGGMPAGGSFSRSALNKLSGARTRWSGAITGLAVLVALPFVGVLAELPKAVLGGLVVAAVVSLLDIRPLWECWRCSLPQFAVGLVTGASTLALAPRVELGVLIGVGAALAVHVWRELHCTVTVEERDTGLVLRPQGVLYFASAPLLEERLTSVLAAHPDTTHVTLELDQVGRIDFTGALAIRDLIDDLQLAGTQVTITGTPPHARRILDRVLT